MVRDSTPPKGKRQLRREQRTEELLGLAMEIVVRDGVDGLTIVKLATAANAAVGALYRYFPSKDALLGGLQIRAVQRLTAFTRARVDPDADAVANVVAAFRSWSAFRTAEPQLFALIDSSMSTLEPVLADDAAREVDLALQPLLAHLAGLLEAAVASGELVPGDNLRRTAMLWAAVHGAEHFRKRDRLAPASIHADAIVTALISDLLRAWEG